MDEERLLGIEELATFLGIPPNTIYSWRVRGGGPTAIKVGRWVKYRPADVKAWLDEQAQTPARQSEVRPRLTSR